MKLKLAQNIRFYRKKAGMTQDDISARLGVSCQSVSRWENETTYPDMELLPALADLFGVSIDKLLGATKEEREAASKAYYDLLNSTVDHRERLALLHKIHEEFPRDVTIVYSLCGETDDLEERRRMTKLLIELSEGDASARENYVPRAIAHLLNTEEDDQVEKLFQKYTSKLALSEEFCREKRYCHRKEWERYETCKQQNLHTLLVDEVFPRLLRDDPQKNLPLTVFGPPKRNCRSSMYWQERPAEGLFREMVFRISGSASASIPDFGMPVALPLQETVKRRWTFWKILPIFTKTSGHFRMEARSLCVHRLSIL